MMERPKWLVSHPWVAAYLARVRDPIIADRSLDLMAAAFWGCLAIWGVSTAITGLATVTESVGRWYEAPWGLTIGILCFVAFTAAVSTFFANPSIRTRIKRKKIEMLFGSLAGGFISVYPALMLLAVFEGDLGRFAPFWATLCYLIVPTWRVRHLYHRIAKLREIALDTGEIPKVTP